MSAQSSWSHWMTVRPGMEARSKGDNRIQVSRADRRTAEMLSEMTREILHSLADVEIGGDAMMLRIETRHAETGVQCIGWPFPFPCTNQFREPVQCARIEPQDFPHISPGGFSAISDDIGGQRWTHFAGHLLHLFNDCAPVGTASNV